MVTIAGPGTTERTWRPRLDRLPELRSPLPRRAVVLAPHPDDEVLAVGGLLALLQLAGTEVHVVAVTDGEASHPGSTALGAERLAARRSGETPDALRELGLPGDVRRLGLPDGGAEALEAPVDRALELRAGDWLLSPFAGDGHPDHEAVGRAGRSAAARTGARVLEFPVWAWHWADPWDRRLPLGRATRVSLPPAVRVAKRRAVARFVSQVEPLGPEPADAAVLGPHVLARFDRPYEVLIT